MKSLFIAVLSVAGVSLASAHCGSCGVGDADKHEGKTAGAGTCASGCCELLSAYEGISTALAADDLKGAQTAAHALSHYAECEGKEDLQAVVAKVEKAGTIDAARDAFKTVSAAVIPLAADGGDHFVMTCPMAKADWIQTSKDVANPYFGSKMLHCGAIKETVAAN